MLNIKVANLDGDNFFLVNQVNTRHHFLSRFIGTKVKEDQSFLRANNVNLWLTITTCLCGILEIVLYLVYNRMVIFTNNECQYIKIFRFIHG